MGKRRSAEKKPYAPRNICGGGGGGPSPFEFNEDDHQVENESLKNLARYGPKSPFKKPQHHRQPVDKYTFLQIFARRDKSQQKDTGVGILDVDGTDCVSDDRTFGTDVAMSFGPLNYESKPFSSPKFQGYDSCEAKSCASRITKPEFCKAGKKKHNKIFHLDSDKVGRLQFGSLQFSDNLEGNEGLPEEHSTESGANSSDCEAVVVVDPYYVKYRKNYYTRCRLTFSQSCIRLKGSPVCDGKTTHYLEWSTFDISDIEHQQCESVKVEVVNLHMKSKDINDDETGDWSSGCGELEFVIFDDPQWPKKQIEIVSLDLKYKAAWRTNVNEFSFKESFDYMVYPDGDPDAVIISRTDVELLQPRTFINDTIIDFYIKYLLNKIKPADQHRFHFFNTFFFRKLADVCQDASRAWEGRDAFQSIHKWTRNVDIFKKDYIFLPVNFSLHWSLIIICHPGEVVNFRDKVMDEPLKVPCILHMDSIRGSHGGLENLIRRFLWEEWKEWGNAHEEDIKIKFLNMEFISVQLPQQENLFDCGLFLLHYTELFLEQASNFSSTKYFDILNKDWFLPAEVSLKKRDFIRNLIHRIVEDNAIKGPRAACDGKYVQGIGTNEGDDNTNFTRKNRVKESCSGVKFNSSDGFDIKRQQSFVPMKEHWSIDESEADECSQPDDMQLPICQFDNLSLPMEEQVTSRQGDTRSSCRIDTQMPSRYQLNRDPWTGENEDPLETDSQTFSEKSLIVIDVQNEEDWGAALAERRKDAYDDMSSMSSEDLAACVVEDSEDESNIPRNRSPLQCSTIYFCDS